MESRVHGSTLDYGHTLSLLEEDWNNQSQMGTPSSVSSSLFDTCRCCGRQDCDSLEYFNRNIKKLESDTRLAAEIGQGLLHKHETFVAESNGQKTHLEKQLEVCHERITRLEQSLDHVETQKDEILKEKNKWFWEYQKRQKMLDETLSDLQIGNEKYNQMSSDLDAKSAELEKLRIFKFMVRHAETREETLLSKLEDTNQELALCRRNELVLESKMKKLKMRYESLYNTHEQLSRDVQDNHKTDTAVIPTLPTVDPIKLVSSTNNNNDLIHLIKELSSANTKLKTDLMNCRDLLSDARGEVSSLLQKIDDFENTPKTLNGPNLQSEMKSKRAATMSSAITEKRLLVNQPKTASVAALPIAKRNKNVLPLPTVSSSMPTATLSGSPATAIVHHHYHYHVKKKNQQEDEEDRGSSDVNSNEFMLDCCDEEKNDLYTAAAMEMGMQNNGRELVLSPSTSSSIMTTIQKEHGPYVSLHEHVLHVLERLRGSDILALNRRLKRAFDIIELSSMSNSVIENILMEIDTLETRFLWIRKEDVQWLGFFPWVDLVKDMLKELGVLRSTMNELQVEYVKKVQESEVRVEQEILTRRHYQNKKKAEEESNKGSWITNFFTGRHMVKAEEDDLRETLTNSSTLIHEEEEVRKDKRHKRRPLPHYTSPPPPPSSIQPQQITPPQMTTSMSNGTSRSSPSIPIRNKRSLHRMPIDYEGIGPASIRPDPAVNFSSSWLGGK
ncbi:hypothetical protein INT47_005700 [Mucor saturninus]|uniref:Uncharacterized protein n=1 Tax=Mucor saturninus TaxID=64648 RepID=A0A8H7QKZ0_9FUNG|nr:hypothetical protein INT47_005700 [Mucor saturninus]